VVGHRDSSIRGGLRRTNYPWRYQDTCTAIVPDQAGEPDSIPASTSLKTSFGYTHQRPDGNRYVLGRAGSQRYLRYR